MRYKAVIFDLDGTILDTLDDLTAAINHALSALGRTELGRDTVRRFVGNGVNKLITRALNYTAGVDIEREPADLFDECYAEFKKYYDAHSADMTAPYRGMIEAIEHIGSLGIKTAVVTNKYDGAAQELKKKFFDVVDIAVGAGGDVRPKPAPDGVNKATAYLGVKIEDCIYVGDGETDIATARACGMPVVAVTWGFRDRKELDALSPDHMIDAPKELLGILEGK